MDHTAGLVFALGLLLECFLSNHPEVEHMMTQASPCKNRLEHVVWRDEGFESVHQGVDKLPLRLHSRRKMGSTQAK